MNEEQEPESGLGRRALIKRGALLGGALVWATPVVQSFAAPAFAAESGSALCTYYWIVVETDRFGNPKPGAQKVYYRLRSNDPECCAAAKQAGAAGNYGAGIEHCQADIESQFTPFAG